MEVQRHKKREYRLQQTNGIALLLCSLAATYCCTLPEKLDAVWPPACLPACWPLGRQFVAVPSYHPITVSASSLSGHACFLFHISPCQPSTAASTSSSSSSSSWTSPPSSAILSLHKKITQKIPLTHTTFAKRKNLQTH